MNFDFKKKYDVVVAGAGIAGISAALAAARRNRKVCLLEKQTLIGGLATAGLIYIYLPLCDGENHQVTFGIAEELLLEGRAFGPFDVSPQWGGKGKELDDALLSEGAKKTSGIQPRTRYACPFTPAGMILKLDELLHEAGVDLWLETLLCGVITERNSVTGVVVENNSGRGMIEGACFIDTTGDAGVVRRAGGDVIFGENKNTPWLLGYRTGNTVGYTLGNSVIMETVSVGKIAPIPYKNTGMDVTKFIRKSWELIRDHYRKIYLEKPQDEVYPLILASMPQFRRISCILARETIYTEDVNTCRNNSVGMVGDWRYAGNIWEIPYGALLPQKLENILVAGRCIGSMNDAWEACRVIPAGAMTGEVAGCGASLSIELGIPPSAVPLETLRNELRKNNFRFHRDEILK